MEKEVFIQQLMEHLPDDVYDCKVGMDMTINSRVVVDDDGWIWVREAESFKRRKTSINVSDVVEFRRDDYYTEYGSFYSLTQNRSWKISLICCGGRFPLSAQIESVLETGRVRSCLWR